MAMRRHSSKITVLTALGFLVGGLCLAACSGAQNKSQDDPEPSLADEPTDSDSPPEMKVVKGDSDSDDEESSDDSPSKKDELPPSDDYDITYQDCKELAGVYYRAWRKPELEKLEAKNFKPKLYETARKNVEKAAQEAGDNWLKECEGTVGTPYLYSRLKCAMKAKTVERFNDCLDGKAD